MTARVQAAELLGSLLTNRDVCRMREYIQHGNVTTYDHCFRVAVLSLRLALWFKLPVNLKILVTAAFLHDFYLYDWHDPSHGHWHGYRHSAIAQANARMLLHQPEAVTRIIGTHMWPLTMRHIPTSWEGWVVCMADKLAATQETMNGIFKKH